MENKKRIERIQNLLIATRRLADDIDDTHLLICEHDLSGNDEEKRKHELFYTGAREHYKTALRKIGEHILALDRQGMVTFTMPEEEEEET